MTANLNTTDLATATARIQALIKDLRGAVVERDAEIRSLAAALVAGQHVLLLGPPGTGKSYLTGLFTAALGSSFFQVLMTKYTVPEEVFGPYSLAGLERDEYRRVVAGYLPSVEVGFLDEALALDTPVPTPGGWTTVGEIKPGDMVIGSDGVHTEVVRLTEIATDHKCYRLMFADGEQIVADAGHKWYAKPAACNNEFKVWTTGEMAADGRMFRLPRNEPIELPDATLPVSPYALGVWLGNGNCWTGEVYVRPEWVDATVAAFALEGLEASSTKVVNDNGTMTAIRLAGTGFRTSLADA